METAPKSQTSFPLHEAVKKGNVEELKTLLDTEGNINVQNYNKDTLLHFAVNKNNHQCQELVTFLLERGANPGLLNKQGDSPLILALVHNPKCVPQLINNGSGKDAVNIPDGWGHYPLHYALENETVLKMLLDNGAFIDSKNRKGRTALHLVSKVINVLTHDRPIELIDNQPNYDFYYNVTNKLLMHGADVNSKDNNGRTPLHINSDIKCVRLLLNKGALVNSRDNRGKTPLHDAVGISYDVANELLMHGAEANSKDNDGNTPLHMARDIKCVELLLQKGAEVNSQDQFGQTILHYLDDFYKGSLTYLHVANILLDWGASLTIKDKRGRTPSDTYPYLLDCAKRHNVRKACVKLSDMPSKELGLKSYKTSCLEEAARLKLFQVGKNSLYDIFGQYPDPKFLSNELLQTSVDMNNYKSKFPIYCYLLQSTYKLAEKRSCMLDDAANILQTPLPREITWYILTFVDDVSLGNVISAKDLK